MTQDNPCIAYRFIKDSQSMFIAKQNGWTRVIHGDGQSNASIVLSYFPVDGEVIQVQIFGDEINVTHNLLTSLNRPIPIPVNFNNEKLAIMLETIWLHCTAAALARLRETD